MDVFGLADATSAEELARLRKRELRNLLTSYADEADVFAEVIQNAWDSLLIANARQLYRPGEVPTITVVIGRRAGGDPHYLMVVDNGTGMAPNVARRFTAPGYSAEKALGRSIGYKGVGASFFFAASNKVGFLTRDASGAVSQATVSGAYAWVMGSQEPVPRVENAMTCPPAVADLLNFQRGTAVYYEFHAGGKPKSLSHIVINDLDKEREAKKWATYLAAKTALGQVNPLSSFTPTINVWLDDGVEVTKTTWVLGPYDRTRNHLGYPYPWRVFAVHKDVEDILSTPEASRSWTHAGKHQALRLRWNKEQVLRLSPPIDFTEEESEVLEANFDFLDVFFAYSTDVLGEVHNRTGTRAKQVRYGVRLAVDGVPQGRMLEFDLTSNTGLARQAHALCAFKKLELDTGRKIPASEVVSEVVRKLTVRAMTQLADFRWAMKKKQRSEPAIDLDSWRSKVEERMSGSIVRTLFERLGSRSPLLVDPDSEQDVIALFTGLLSASVLKGYTLAALSGFNRYDGLITIDDSSAQVTNHDDALSVQAPDAHRGGALKVIEFKQQFQDLLLDFDEAKKRPQDIDLHVCWTLPKLNVGRGSLRYTYGDRRDFRQVYGMTHLWADENDTSEIPVISLKHLVCEALMLREANEPGIGTARFNELLLADRDASI
ncbi:hypothetical protein ACFWZU_02410 [Frateuria sp. GZRR33]|uniref:hypothetical protein n=1 Tax=Frateuria sp. GZRR33 TaxID=3351535 RepID=UPI003EDC6BD6